MEVELNNIADALNRIAIAFEQYNDIMSSPEIGDALNAIGRGGGISVDAHIHNDD